jgi:hypothetical protein
VKYSLQYDPVTVLPYLMNNEDLGRLGRIALHDQLDRNLRVMESEAISDPSRRLSPDSDCFWAFALVQSRSGGRLLFRFAVSDRAAQFGVLQIRYVDYLEWIDG